MLTNETRAAGGKREGAGRKPKAARLLKLKLSERTDDAKAAFDFLVKVRADKNEPTSIRIEAAKQILDRVCGKPSQLLGSDPENPLPSGIVVLPAQDLGERGKVEK